MESLKNQLKALKEKRARLLAEVDAEIRLIKTKISDEAWSKNDDKSEALRVRDELIVKLREEGKTFAHIGEIVGVSVGRAQQIVQKSERKKRREELLTERARAFDEEQKRLDRERTVTVVINSPVTIYGAHYEPGSQARVTPLVAGNLVAARRGGFATEDDYEAFLVAYPGERKSKA